MSKKFFGGNIEPECRCCAHGRASADGAKVFCEKQGVRLACDACRKFSYDPLRRVPSAPVVLPSMESMPGLGVELDLDAPMPERR